MKSLFSLAAGSCLLVAGGCAVTADGGGASLGGATTVELREPLVVETGWARSFVQHGQSVNRGDLARFDPYCSFEVTEVARTGSRIEVNPDTFTITRISHKPPVGGVFAGALDIEEDVGPVEPEVDIYLASDNQPSVIRLRCAKWESDALFASRVNFQDVRGVLGGIASIR